MRPHVPPWVTAIVVTILLFCAVIAFLWYTPLGKALHVDHSSFFDGFIGGLCGAAVTAILAWIAYIQLGGIAKTTSADFLLKLKRDFFRRRTRRLMQLIDGEWLAFIEVHDGENAFFRVDGEGISASELPEVIQGELRIKAAYPIWEVDDALLGHFEDIGILEESGVLDFNMVHEEFSWYIETAWDNCEIQKYIRWGRKSDNDLYSNFEHVYWKCRKRSERRGMTP